MADSAKKAEMRRRVGEARERLRRVTKSGRRGPIGPAADDKWHRGHVMGHAAEALNFWTTQFRAVRSGANEVGRGEEGGEKRRQGIDRGEAVAEEELQQALDDHHECPRTADRAVGAERATPTGIAAAATIWRLFRALKVRRYLLAFPS